MVEMDKVRAFYEERLHHLQIELVENKRRWEDANNLIVSGQKEIITDIDNNNLSESLLKNFGVDSRELQFDNRSVFVLTPFLGGEIETFTAIKDVCTEVNLNCTRGDETYREKDLLVHIVTSIAQSAIIIANINGRNPNVFYELGICHSMGKPVILISKTKNELPFDIQSKNIVFYNNKNDLQSRLKSELLKIFIDKA